MHLPPLILDLALILAVAGVISIIFMRIRQPVVLGYLLAGVVVGPYTPPFHLITDMPSIQTWAELGIIFLMFTLGLEFSFRKLMTVGFAAITTGVLEITFFMVIGHYVGRYMGLSTIGSLFLGAMLAMSSTTIIIKALDELKLKTHRFASLIFGILIVEDLIAILLLVGLTNIATTQIFSLASIASATINLLLVTASWFIIGYLLVPRMMSFIAKKGTNEMVTLVAIGLCLGLVVFSTKMGYSPALGAFIMGSILAETKIIHKIEGLMSPLKDLFGAIFFVSIGMLIDPKVIWEQREVIIFLTILIIVGKIFIGTVGSLLSGQPFQSSLQVGLGLAQIGEFSFIIVGVGVALKAVDSSMYPIAVAVSSVTTFTTPYLIKYSLPIAQAVENRLPISVKTFINGYAIWWERQLQGKNHYGPAIRLLVKWALNGVIVTIIFNNCFKTLLPKLIAYFPKVAPWHTTLTWIIGLLISSPFIWGMVFSSKKRYRELKMKQGPLEILIVLALPVLTAIWIGLIASKHLPLMMVWGVTILFLIVIYAALYHKLERYYGWFEGKFLSSFLAEKEPSHTESISSLVPWEAHLYSFEVHPNSALVGRSLMDAEIRRQYGVNVVAIKRGARTIITPRASEKIFPYDQFIVLGTDEQLDQLRVAFDAPTDFGEVAATSVENYALRQLLLTPDSLFVGKTIQESKIQEKHHVLVVGIERDSQRITSPRKDFTFRAQDIVWVVGPRSEQVEPLGLG